MGKKKSPTASDEDEEILMDSDPSVSDITTEEEEELVPEELKEFQVETKDNKLLELMRKNVEAEKQAKEEEMAEKMELVKKKQ